MVGIVATVVQLFFAWRVKVLVGNIWLVGLISITALGSICEFLPLPLHNPILARLSLRLF